MSDLANMDLTTLKVTDLKRELKNRGLTTSGKKEELLERLQLALMGESSADLLADEDTETAANTAEEAKEPQAQTEDAEMAAASKKKVAIKRDNPAPATEETPSEAAQEKENIAEGAPAPKRALITSPSAEGSNLKETKVRNRITFDSEPAKTETEVTEAAEGEKKDTEEEKTTKTTGATDADRAKARAERFGIKALGDEGKKNLRAERFGVQANGAAAANGAGDKKAAKLAAKAKLGEAPTADLETLKKRAERFGTNTSTTMKKAELDAKIKARMDRFGAVTKTVEKVKVETNTGVNSVVEDEKLKKRAERFGVKA